MQPRLQKDSRKISTVQQTNVDNRDIDVRFETIFFQIVL
jgi:hypothetical protein